MVGHEPARNTATLFLCGDVMTGRGIDQILPKPSSPELAEPFVDDAREYVALAESAHGRIPRAVEPAYVWGDAIAVLDRIQPDARIINLETSITTSDARWPEKGIHYRMHPANIACLTAARTDVAVLANNHTLDYGRSGLVETLDTLHRAGIVTAGAGRDVREAQEPAALSLEGRGRTLIFACAAESSGVVKSWAAHRDPGLDVLPDVSAHTAAALARRIGAHRRPHDLVVVSIHWGSNWGYEVPPEHTRFARQLVDEGVDIVHGHSSHHPRPIEVYRDRLILYGCGDFINDYEGIEGYEQFRGDLVLMYFVSVAAQRGMVAELRLVPLQLRNFRLNHPMPSDTAWMRDTLDRVCAPFGCHVEPAANGELALRWAGSHPREEARS